MNPKLPEITTVALLQRRAGLSDALFSAYWRDVHGVLAARIPGFWSYVQNHVQRVDAMPGDAASAESPIQMDGFAEVCFASEDDRQGLANSAITPLILRDEPHVFSRTLLYSLEPGASCSLVGRGVPDAQTPAASFVLLLQSAADAADAAIREALQTQVLAPLQASAGLVALRRHLLGSGDPARWNTVAGVDNGVRGDVYSVALQASWQNLAQAQAALAALPRPSSAALRGLALYRVTARYEMVMQGRPTMLGLRGLSALQTIEAAGADNQKQDELIVQLYGESARGLHRA